jgi:hypothetical protein
MSAALDAGYQIATVKTWTGCSGEMRKQASSKM